MLLKINKLLIKWLKMSLRIDKLLIKWLNIVNVVCRGGVRGAALWPGICSAHRNHGILLERQEKCTNRQGKVLLQY